MKWGKLRSKINHSISISCCTCCDVASIADRPKQRPPHIMTVNRNKNGCSSLDTCRVKHGSRNWISWNFFCQKIINDSDSRLSLSRLDSLIKSITKLPFYFLVHSFPFWIIPAHDQDQSKDQIVLLISSLSLLIPWNTAFNSQDNRDDAHLLLERKWQPVHILLQHNKQPMIKHPPSTSLVSVKRYRWNASIEMRTAYWRVQETSMSHVSAVRSLSPSLFLLLLIGPHCHLLLCIDHIHEHENLLRYEIEQLINGNGWRSFISSRLCLLCE